MQTSNHQKKVKLKANVADLVGAVLKQLKQAKGQFSKNPEIIKIINEFSTKFGELENYFGEREEWESNLIKCIGSIVRQIDKWSENENVSPENASVMTDLKNIVEQIVHEQGKNTKNNTNQPSENASVTQEAPHSDNADNVGHSELLQCMTELSPQLRNCVYSLCVFPEKTELKKRLLVYWWIGLFFDPLKEKKTAEDFGHTIFYILMCKGVIIPTNFKEHNQVVDRCMVEPRIHRQLINACNNGFFRFQERVPKEEGSWHFYNTVGEQKALLNLNQMYLSSENILNSENSTNDIKIAEVHVFQLGRWRYIEVQDEVQHTTTTGEVKSKDHIEVDDTKFLKKLGEGTTYLSLQGISGVQQLPESVGKLSELLILDLRACHNLETLPEKTEPINPWSAQKWFKRLTHLDITECYLLDHMPKWVCELSNLEVLKGFVVSSGSNNKQFCRLSDLSKLKKLTKLSIKVTKKEEDFNGWQSLEKLTVLTIIWGLREEKKDVKEQNSKNENDGLSSSVAEGGQNPGVSEGETQAAKNANDVLSSSVAEGGQNPGVSEGETQAAKNEMKELKESKTMNESRTNEQGKQKDDEIKNEIVEDNNKEIAENGLSMPNDVPVLSGDPDKQNLIVGTSEIVEESSGEIANNGFSMPNDQTGLSGNPGKQNLDVENNEITMESSRENANHSLSMPEVERGQKSRVSKDESKVTKIKSSKNMPVKQKDAETKSEKKKLEFSFPKNLEKLDIRCYPDVMAPELLNPKKLKSLKRLYIRGGKLTDIVKEPGWNVEILRLRFIENLKIDRSLPKFFGKLKYVECEKYSTLFPKGVSRWTWQKETDGTFSDQLAKLREWELDGCSN